MVSFVLTFVFDLSVENVLCFLGGALPRLGCFFVYAGVFIGCIFPFKAAIHMYMVQMSAPLYALSALAL